MGWLGELGMQVGGKGLDLGHGLILGKFEDRRQLKQTKRLMKLEEAYQKRMAEFNQGLSMQMWEDTNYAAQRRQLEKAGLNPALMYGGVGAGGSTQGAGSGDSPRAGHATAGMPLGMQIQTAAQQRMLQAQIDNIKADTNKKTVEAQKLGGVDTDAIMTAMNNMKQSTDNAALQNQIMELERQLKVIEANKAGATAPEQIKQAQILTRQMEDAARSAKAKGDIDEGTAQNLITNSQLVNNELQVKIESGKTGIEATKTGIQATKTGIEATKAGIEQTKQQTANLQQDEIQKILENAMRAEGIQPHDNALFRKTIEALNGLGLKPKELGAKTKIIMLWLKGQAGEQTIEHLKELLK